MEWPADPNLYPPYLRSRIRHKRGIGKGTSYRPWLTVRDVPSKGNASSIHGIRVDRNFQLLSDLELTYLLICERQPDVVDIREQWPILDISATLAICSKYGVRHPTKGIYPDPFTIDFVITRQTQDGLSYTARSIKGTEDREKPEVKRRLAVEFEWCTKHGLPWAVVDTALFDPSVDPTVLDTLKFMRAWFVNRYTPISGIKNYVRAFHKLHEPNMPLIDIARILSQKLSISVAISQDSFRYCAWNNLIPVSLVHPLQLNLPVILDG